ncbi:hypothetical protein Pla110_22240 [Polystyrenella longa]|uniref:Uncharacterized protein n=1 Tax=Polystyrenella longa TaxID=2528007 RepID=A0A518CMR9_9PLAN|nr:hypothetical protein [Polystyrenella longa]QDU80494.1 hypothetical protein Pla110_22240 [Polystyrenella longa]
MADETTGMLVGFVHPTGTLRFPTFLIPVFEVQGHLSLQDGNCDGKIEKFNRLYPIDHIWMKEKPFRKHAEKRFFIIWEIAKERSYFDILPMYFVHGMTDNSVERVQIGDDFRIAYADRITGVRYGNKLSLRKYLVSSADFYAYNPFFALEVAEFIGNKKQYQRALERATNILMGENEDIAFAWRRMMQKEDEDNDNNTMARQ